MARSITVIPASQPYRVGGRTQQKTRNLRVAAYCRVSTDQEEQLNSFENQVEYYTKYIQDNPLYQMAGIYADVYNQRLIPFDTKMAVKMIK